MNEIWKPHVTVAAVIERDGRFLFVEEETTEGIRLNQPAGHLDEGESLLEGCARETLEETAWRFRPTDLIGVYLWPRPKKAGEADITYLRFAFSGVLGEKEIGRPLDTGILRAVWLTPEEVNASRERHRSPLVAQCVDDYLSGRRHPLEILRHYG